MNFLLMNRASSREKYASLYGADYIDQVETYTAKAVLVRVELKEGPG